MTVCAPPCWAGTPGGDDLEEHEYVDISSPPEESFISDPPDGKIPYQPWAQALAEARKTLKAAKVDTMAIEVDQQIVLVDRVKFRGAGIAPEVAIKVFEDAARALPGIARIDRFAALARDSASDPVSRRWSHQF